MKFRGQWAMCSASFLHGLHSPPEQPSIGQASLDSSHFRKLAASLMAKVREETQASSAKAGHSLQKVDFFIKCRESYRLGRPICRLNISLTKSKLSWLASREKNGFTGPMCPSTMFEFSGSKTDSFHFGRNSVEIEHYCRNMS